MNLLFSLVVVLALVAFAFFGAQSEALRWFLGVVFPYLAMFTFLVGIVWRVVRWAKSPVPFRIPTTCGQQKSLPWIRQNKIDNPSSTLGVIGRMFLEVFFFRSLFRNTKAQIVDGRPVYSYTKWLWLGGMVFHYTFLMIFLRHMRFFAEPAPGFVRILEAVDGFFQIGVPVLFLTSFLFVAALGYLFLRRLVSAQIRYISLAADYFPLLLLLAIGITGIWMRHFDKVDIVGVKELTMGLITFQPTVPAYPNVHALAYLHIFLVSMLFLVFPFTKLMHMAGVFLSPTRNLANNNRAKRHINPWNHPVKTHTYEEYEDDFRDKMKAAGIPVEKE